LQDIRAHRRCGRLVGQLPASTEHGAVGRHGGLRSCNGPRTQNLLPSRLGEQEETVDGYSVTRFGVRHVWSRLLFARSAQNATDLSVSARVYNALHAGDAAALCLLCGRHFLPDGAQDESALHHPRTVTPRQDIHRSGCARLFNT
ncbi:hypothetical protein Cfor_02732, partial [Coptotermes formosanus]